MLIQWMNGHKKKIRTSASNVKSKIASMYSTHILENRIKGSECRNFRLKREII